MSGTILRRMVLQFGHEAVDPAAMRVAAGLARFLGVSLHALFVEDETLPHVCAFPFTREFSPLSFQWRPMDHAQLEAGLRAAAERVRLHLIAAGRAAGVAPSFEVRRGDAAERSLAGDIIVIAQPSGRGFVTDTYLNAPVAAHRSAGSILFLPPLPARGGDRPKGLIVAVAARPDDSAPDTAARIAAASGRPLLVLATSPMMSRFPDHVPVRRLAGNTPHDIVAALGGERETLIVVAQRDAEAGAALSAARGVPVLVLPVLAAA